MIKRHGELDVPPIAETVRGATEVLRVWTVADGPHQVTLRTTWDDPALWGMLLVDIARHTALAYARNGLGRDEAFERIRAGWIAELSSPTDDPVDLTPED